MLKTRLLAFSLAATLAAAFTGLPLRAADEVIDYDSINKIKREGLDPARSKVMEISSYLTDVYGPRLTGSPNILKAGEWSVAQMKQWGLVNTALEPWTPCPPPSAQPAAPAAAQARAGGGGAAGAGAGGAGAGGGGGGGGRGGGPRACQFPRGWTNDKFYMQAVAPQQFPIHGTPSGWSVGTNGLVRGEVVMVTETAEDELKAKYPNGALRGKWVISSPPPDVAAYWNPLATRRTAEELQRMASPAPPTTFGRAAAQQQQGGRGGGRGGGGGFNRTAWFKAEGVLGVLSTQARGHGIYTISGSSTTNPETGLPAITIPAEQYGRIARILAKEMPVTIEADIRNTYHPNPPMFNVVGEIRGTDKADEVVMIGAHFDSWHASTGATDNAAGSAAMLEAMRILKATGVPLRRTVRIGLWTGEEQGLHGSRDYVERHYGRAGGSGGRGGRGGGGGGAAPETPPPPPTPPSYTPAHAKFSAYYNIDNGTGAIRGVYLQRNQAVASIFRAWMEPFHGLGMSTLTLSNTGGTDHQSFDDLNLPGFQFIQDEVEYDTMTHHTNLDSYERLQPEDMRRNATIAAAFAFLTANRDALLPRKPPTSMFGG
jgi:hypothetical protein